MKRFNDLNLLIFYRIRSVPEVQKAIHTEDREVVDPDAAATHSVRVELVDKGAALCQRLFASEATRRWSG